MLLLDVSGEFMRSRQAAAEGLRLGYSGALTIPMVALSKTRSGSFSSGDFEPTGLTLARQLPG